MSHIIKAGNKQTLCRQAKLIHYATSDPSGLAYAKA